MKAVMKREEQPNVLNSAGPRPLGIGEYQAVVRAPAWPLSDCRDNEAIKAAEAANKSCSVGLLGLAGAGAAAHGVLRTPAARQLREVRWQAGLSGPGLIPSFGDTRTSAPQPVTESSP